MNRLKSLLILTVATVLLWSCDSILNTKPQQSISEDDALNTSSNVIAVLVGAYDAMGDVDVYGGRMLMLPDLLADEGDVIWSGTFEQPRQVFLNQIRVDNSFIAGAWLDAYEVINIVNNVLSAIDVVNAADQDRVRGEAFFIRGTVYFELVRVFGKAWNEGDPAQNLGVPLITEPTREIGEEDEIPRNTVQEIYTQVLEDLTSAKDLLPETNGTFATTYAASGMLSRVYLQQGNYAGAATEANRVIESGNYSLVQNYADAFNNSNVNTSEDVFAIQVTTQDGANALHNFYASNDAGGRGDIEVQDQHLNKYEAGDERFDLFYTDAATGEIRVGKWMDQFGNINIIRLAELYLTRAEANFQLGIGSYVGPAGTTPESDLNVVRNRVNLPDILIPTLADIRNERLLELAFEGHELHDKKRWEMDVGTIPWNDPSLVYPVPLRELNANKALVQNEGYGGSN